MAHVLYPLFYSLISTTALLIILFAQLQRLQKEHIPINYGIIKVLTITSLVMWGGTGLTTILYMGGTLK